MGSSVHILFFVKSHFFISQKYKKAAHSSLVSIEIHNIKWISRVTTSVAFTKMNDTRN